MAIEKLSPSDFKKLSGWKDNEEKTNRNHIILGFYDFECSPNRITEKLDLEPTRTGVKGEEYDSESTNVKKTRECNLWEIESKSVTNEFIGNIVDEFVSTTIEKRFNIIKEFSCTCQTKLTIVQYYFDGYNPGQFFSNRLVKLLSDINAEIDIDIYCLCENE